MRVILSLLFCILLTGAPCVGQPALRDVRVALRTDDVFMSDTAIQPQEIDSMLAVVERHGAKMQLAVIPHRLLEPRNADGEMGRVLRKCVVRGHMVSQHGWTHRHTPTASTGAEFQDPLTGEWVPQDTIRYYLKRGKEVLEQTIGRSITTYVSPGDDDQLHPVNLEVLQALGFRWMTGRGNAAPIHTDSIGYLPDMPEFTWALTEESYAAALDSAKIHFLQTIAGGSYWSHCFHDHFTRHAWHSGIVARWTDELLTWMEHLPGIRIRYVTADEL
jgi:hypothetical protein